MSGRFFGLSVLLLAAVAYRHVECACTREAIFECKQLIPLDFATPVENFTREDFRQECGRNVSAFKSCVDGIQCGPNDNAQLFGYHLKYLDAADGFVYLCQSNTQSTLFARPDCIRSSFEHHRSDCADSVTAAKNDRDKCRYLYERAECAYDGTMRLCSDWRTAELVKRVVINAHKHQYEGAYGCTTGPCHEVALDECQAYTQVKADLAKPILHYDTEQKLNAVCGKLAAVKECIAKTKCGRYKDGSIDRYTDAFTYLCNSANKKVYLNSTDCLTSPETKVNLTECDHLANSTALKRHDACAKHRKVKACRRAAYTDSCGAQTADVIMTAQDKLDDCPCRKIGRSDGGVQTIDFHYGTLIVGLMATASLLFNVRRPISSSW